MVSLLCANISNGLSINIKHTPHIHIHIRIRIQIQIHAAQSSIN